MLRSSSADFRASSDIAPVINNLRNIVISNISESKWKELLSEQDFDNYIFQVREDLLSRVFDEIQQKYLEKRAISYTVECAYDSWKKVICLNFLFYDPCDEVYKDKSSWTEDPEPETCRPDTWSRGNILTEKDTELLKPERIDTVLSDYQIIKLKDYPTENYFSLSQNNVDTIEQIKEQQSLISIPGEYQSQTNFMYTSPASTTKISSESNIIINKIDSEGVLPPISTENFFKNIKRAKPTICDSTSLEMNILPSKRIPIYSTKYEEKKIILPPLRMSVVSNLRRSAGSLLQTSLTKLTQEENHNFPKKNSNLSGGTQSK